MLSLLNVYFNRTVNITSVKALHDPPNDVTKPRCTVQYAYVSNLIRADLVIYDLASI